MKVVSTQRLWKKLVGNIAGIGILFFLIACSAWSESGTVLGLDRLVTDHLDRIQNKRVAIIGNHTSVNAKGESIVSLLGQHAKIVALFGPEHGFAGNESAGADISASVLQGIPIYSLYGDFRTPTPKMLKDVDVLVYDIQDVGVRFYTYISSLFLALDAAKKNGIPIVVLDRPNPVSAQRVEGAILNPAHASFVGVMPLPIRYGMTVGELAQLMNRETYAGFSIGADLTVIPMTEYRREMWYDETKLPWIAPSPNMPTLETAILYPGLCLVEGSNLSEGRGTETPFQTIGAPFIDAEKWLKAIPAEVCAGVDVKAIRFTPKSIPGKSEDPKFKDQLCRGLQISVTDRSVLKPIDLAVALFCSAQSLYPEKFKLTRTLDRLWGDESLRAMIEEGSDYKTILQSTVSGIERFQTVRKPYLLYP